MITVRVDKSELTCVFEMGNLNRAFSEEEEEDDDDEDEEDEEDDSKSMSSA